MNVAAVPAFPHRRLGRSELEVSRVALGSWRTFERMPRQAAEAVLAYAREQGIDFLDDARYDDESGEAPLRTGFSEVLFGELFRAVGWPRDEAIVSNKLWWEFWPDQTAVQELEASLERMGFDRLDLLYSSTLPDEVSVHTAVEQIATTLATGRVRAWGVVNWSAHALHDAVHEAARLGIAPPCAAQLPYSLVRTDWVEDPAMTSALAAADASLVPSASLAGGALTGKYAAPDARGRLVSELADPRLRSGLRVGAALGPLAERLDTTPATLAVAFTLCHPRTAGTLIGATAARQLDQAIAAVGLAARLTESDLGDLRALAAGTAQSEASER
jgi:aryl-alcohol dehydrogenase-like predicted oxidoreductase